MKERTQLKSVKFTSNNLTQDHTGHTSINKHNNTQLSGGKLHSVKPLLGYSNLSNLSRQDAVVLRRLRIAHTRLTHSYLLNRQDQPECSHCDCALTVAHVLLECNHCNVVRQRYFNVSSLNELFDTVNAQNILGFIRDIGLYRLL